MLWDRINQYKEPVSVTFCILFSFTSLFWNGNLFVRGVASSKALSDTVSASIDSVGDLLKSSYKKLESFETVRKERDFYQKIAEEYKLLPQDLEKLKNENDALRKELGFSPKIDYPTVKSEILSVRLNSIYRTIIIDKGSDSGIKPYMPVIGRAIDEKGQVLQALVGKVIAVSGSSSVVQPLINSNFTMGIRLPGTNLWASLSGNSGRGTEAILSFIDNGIIIDPRVFSTFQPGPNPLSTDTLSTASLSKLGKGVFTSGGSGIFPAGIPVGVITEEGARTGSFKTAYLRPYIKF
ncbi:MAG: rod shape-determining protein MreC, partial [Leptospira sp.]|nr:rod shape-determining protein MreC [Leptospira sp.]